MSSLWNGQNLPAYDGGGDVSAPNPITGFVTLDVDAHYFVIPGAHAAEGVSVQIITDATIAGTFTIEGCNLPLARGGTSAGPSDADDYSEVSGQWVEIDTTDAGHAQAAGTGWTATALTLVKTAGAGGAIITLPHACWRRLRIKADITTGGSVRVVAHGRC